MKNDYAHESNQNGRRRTLKDIKSEREYSRKDNLGSVAEENDGWWRSSLGCTVQSPGKQKHYQLKTNNQLGWEGGKLRLEVDMQRE